MWGTTTPKMFQETREIISADTQHILHDMLLQALLTNADGTTPHLHSIHYQVIVLSSNLKKDETTQDLIATSAVSHAEYGILFENEIHNTSTKGQ
jgi:hypothetical protein